MKKILFATLVALSITFVSCTSDAIGENTSTNNISSQNTEVLLFQKVMDTTGGQAANTPPPPPPVTP